MQIDGQTIDYSRIYSTVERSLHPDRCANPGGDPDVVRVTHAVIDLFDLADRLR
jgi:hypothetical protein